MKEQNEERRIQRRQLLKALPALAVMQLLSRPVKASSATSPGADAASRKAERPFRIGLSIDTLAGTNVNDARAAYRVWSQEIAHGLDLTHSEIIPEIFIPSSQMIQMIRTAELDCFALTAWEFAKVNSLIDPSVMMVEDYATEGIEYVLLAHSAGPYKSLQDLRGAKIAIHHHRDTILLEAWLSVLLSASGLPPADSFFESVEARDNLNEVILPLFFRRVHAIGVARRSFATAVELNPQLGRDLRVLASSPRVVGDGFFFRMGCNSGYRREFQDALDRFRALPAGKQCLALYQSTGFFARPCSIMNNSLDLIRQYEKGRKVNARRTG